MVNNLDNYPEAHFDIKKMRNRLGHLIESMKNTWKDSCPIGNSDSSAHDITLYFVDADIVKLYMAPHKNINYSIFGNAIKNLQIYDDFSANILEFVSNFIFFQLQYEKILLFPSHIEELEKLMINVTDNAIEENNNCWYNVNKKSENLVSNIQSNSSKLINKSFINDNELYKQSEFYEEIKDIIINTINNLRSGPVSELLSIRFLLNNERIDNIERQLFVNKNGKNFYLSPFEDDGNYSDYIQLAADSLLEDFPDKKKSENNKRDAQALACLSWINEKLNNNKIYIKISDERIRLIKRAVLITGSKTIFHAVRSNKSEYSPKNLIIHPASLLGHKFIDNFIIGNNNKNLINVNESQVKAKIDFLQEIHNKALKQINKYNDEIEIIDEIKNNIVQITKEYSDLAISWQAKQLYIEEKPVFGNLIKDLNDTNDYNKLKKMLNDITIITWSSFTGSMHKFDSLMVKFSDNSLVDENIPPVRFEHYPEVQKEIRQFYTQGARKKNLKLLGDKISDKKYIDFIYKHDESGYILNIHFVLFAIIHRLFDSAKGHAKVAIGQIIYHPSSDLQGDNALYLLSYIYRHVIKSYNDLEISLSYINEAISKRDCEFELYESGKKRSKASKYIQNLVNLTLDCEKYSVLTRMNLYEKLFSDGNASTGKEVDLINFFDNGIRLYNKFKDFPCYNNLNVISNDIGAYQYEYSRQECLSDIVKTGFLILFFIKINKENNFEIEYKKNNYIITTFDDIANEFISQYFLLENLENNNLNYNNALPFVSVFNKNLIITCDIFKKYIDNRYNARMSDEFFYGNNNEKSLNFTNQVNAYIYKIYLFLKNM